MRRTRGRRAAESSTASPGDRGRREEALGLGFHLSFSGVVTFPKAVELREALALTPLDRLLVETDAPYLAPVPYRGKRNEPAYLVETAKKVAESKGMSVEALAEQTTRNWRNLCLRAKAANGYT